LGPTQKRNEINIMVRNLITGIGGFVASHLADYLIERGEEVIGTCRWTEDLTRIEHIKDKITLVPMDLNDYISCQKVILEYEPDYIFHLAAQSYVTDSFIYPSETIRINTIGTLNLLEAIRFVKELNTYNPTVHVCSSSEVYGLVKQEDIPIKETQAFNPANPYAVGKVGEDMIALMYWTNYKIKTIRTRMFTHTGPRRTMMSAECNFARQITLIEKGKQEPIISHGNLDSIRTWADVRDACKAYHVLVRKGKPGEAYNIGGNTTKTIGEMLDYLISLSPMKDKIKKQLDKSLLRPYDVTLQVPDTSKFKNDTGWEPEIPFEQTMLDLLNWWRENEL
jgi:GDP-mannose 4,6-dehydratase